MKALLTVPVLKKTLEAVRQRVEGLPSDVQAYEIWIDQLNTSECTPERIEMLCRDLRSLSTQQIVVVCKDSIEQGSWKGSSAQKRELLLSAARGGAHYIDIGLHVGASQIRTIAQSKGKAHLIVSWHDFGGTPTVIRLQNLSQKMADLGADVVKIAAFAEDASACDRLISLAQELQARGQAHIILGMGPFGVSTRLLANKLGNLLNFVTLTQQTAPGQLSLQQMIDFQAVL